jgi:hypothetical protein
MEFVFPALTYLALLTVNWLTNRSDFARCPEKGERYKLLPIPYKLGCWLGVIPMFVAGLFVHAAFWLASLVSFAVLEIACVRWYQKKGLLHW